MTEILVPAMFVALLVSFLMGYPVAFTLGGLSVIFGLATFGYDFFTILPMRMWSRMNSFTMVAVPLFIFMGVMLQRTGIAEELLDSMAGLFGRVRGGLAVSVVLVGALLAATTGIIAATVVAMGVISLPLMLQRGYKAELATGTICASGTLCQIIPPSLALVLLGDVIGVPVGALFAGAFIPGVILVGLYVLFILIKAFVRPDVAPSHIDTHNSAINRKQLALRTAKAIIPPGFLIVAVLGTIFFGIASPTESAAMGSLGAVILSLAKRNFCISLLKEVMYTTTSLCSMAFLILLGAASFGLVFRGIGGDEVTKQFLLGMGGGPWGVLALIVIIIFLLGFFLDWIEITFIVIPIIAPIIKEVGFDPVWFSILICISFQCSFLTPPFGFALFFLKGVAPEGVTVAHMYRGVIPFIVLQIIGLMIVMFFPSLATWLPRVMFG
ncbi:MAG: TRAP transporter large permease subunit [Desulfomonilaceae bacterium]|nr:TRAP transporter large permease subunit [Desulfomonilaceae bacterium]